MKLKLPSTSTHNNRPQVGETPFDAWSDLGMQQRSDDDSAQSHDRLIAPQLGLGPKRLVPQNMDRRPPPMTALRHRLDAQQALEALFDEPRQASTKVAQPPVIVRKRRLPIDAPADSTSGAMTAENAAPQSSPSSESASIRPRGRIFRLDRPGCESTEQRSSDDAREVQSSSSAAWSESRPAPLDPLDRAPLAHAGSASSAAVDALVDASADHPQARPEHVSRPMSWAEAEKALGLSPHTVIDEGSVKPDSSKLAPSESASDAGDAVESKPAQIVVTAREMRERVDAMQPLQALAWLLVTPEAELKPLSEDDAEQRIDHLLARCTAAQLHELKPLSEWIADPLLELVPSPKHRFEREAPAHQRLPGNVPAQLGDRGPFEPRKRSAAPVWRIEAISLLGIVIVANRRSALARFEATKVDPLRPAARLLRLDRSQEGAEQVVNGYALALHVCASECFDWIEPRLTDLRARAKRSSQRLTEALAHAIDAWSSRERRLDESCARMTMTMLQLGALIDLEHLMHFCPPSTAKQPLAAWSWLAQVTHERDPHGLAALQMLVSAGTFGYDLALRAGAPSPLAPYVRADEHEAVAVLLQAGMDPLVEDADGVNALQVGEAAGASESVAAIERHLDTTLVPALRAEEIELKQRIIDLERSAQEMKELDKILRAAAA